MVRFSRIQLHPLEIYTQPTIVTFCGLTLTRYGFWGICYTYATWFAVVGLAACGKNYSNSPVLRKACEFLLSKQLPCGGWGESYLSSQNEVTSKSINSVTYNRSYDRVV